MKLLNAVAVISCLSLSAVAGESRVARQAGFASKPVARKDGKEVRISFSVTAPIDVEVSVLGTDGKLVRRLAAGLLGDNAPEPFAKGLSQDLTWDGKDDAGRDVSGARVRVSLGLRADLDRIIGWSGQTLGGVQGLAAGPDGTLYVVHGGKLLAHHGHYMITAFDKDGKYLREVLPGPAGLPPEKRQGWPHVKLDDGAEVPVIWHLMARSTYPGVALASRVFPVVTRDGRLVTMLANGGEKHDDLRGGRSLMILGGDGSVPENLLGPEVCPRVDGFGHIALSPDEKYVYATGFVSLGKKGQGPQNVVYRLSLDGSEKSRIFLGGEIYKPGGGKTGLNDPQGIATDRDGNIYVSDYGNNRVAVFESDGKYLDEIRVDRPDTVHVSRKTGAVYVIQIKPHTKDFTNEGHWGISAHNWWATRVIKLGGLRDKTEKASWTNNLRTSLGGGGFMTLDESGEETVLWVSGMSHLGGPVMKFVDKGGELKLLGTPIDDLAVSRKEVGLDYIADVAVLGDKVLTQHPALGSVNARSLAFSSETGEPVGYYTPLKADGKTTENVWSLLYGEAASGADGNMYYHAKSNMIRRYDALGKRLPFFPEKADDKGVTDGFITGVWHKHSRGAGMFIDRQGTIFAPSGTDGGGIDDMKVKVIGSDGKIRNDCAVHVQGTRLGGIAVDSRGNIYLGTRCAPTSSLIPECFTGKLPEDSPSRHPSSDYRNVATLVKFPATGGAIEFDPGGNWTSIAQYNPKSTSLKNALWTRRVGYVGSHGVDLGCHCETSRFDIDGYDRIFVPDVFRFRVYVLDSNGNELTHFGSYGNMDSRGPGSPVPNPEISFAWPLSAECGNDKVYVADVINKRVVAVKFGFAASEEVPIR